VATPSRAAVRALAAALAVILLEASARVAYFVVLGPSDREAYELIAAEDVVNSGTAFHFLPHHYLVYVPRPDPRGVWTVNALGFRGPEIPREKPDGTVRIACLGGSTTFGSKQTEDGLTYPRRLEELLRASVPSARIEVVNAGVHGWTSAETFINFQMRVLELSPDAVVVYEGINDVFALAAPEQGGADYLGFRRRWDGGLFTPAVRTCLRLSYAARLGVWAWFRGTRGALPWDISAWVVKSEGSEAERLARLDAADGRHFRRNIESLVRLAAARGVPPVLVTVGHGPFHPALARLNEVTREVARETGAILVDFERTAGAGSFTEDRVHLTDEGNVRLARAVAEALRGPGGPASLREVVAEKL
jgi:lysophospholipase L1-like esterase